jgi:CheY-like chemotaxis protein
MAGVSSTGVEVIGLRIMVVEDEFVVALSIRDELKRMGHSVSAIASSGEEAILKARDTAPELALVDMMLEGDMDGAELAQRLRRLFGIPALLVTARADAETMRRGNLAEPLGFVFKPFDYRDLSAALEIAADRGVGKDLANGPGKR